MYADSFKVAFWYYLQYIWDMVDGGGAGGGVKIIHLHQI